MKYYGFLLVLCLFFPTFIEGQSPRKNSNSSWFPISSKESGFSIKFPVKPTIKTSNASGLNINSFSVGEASATYFSVSVLEIPAPNKESMDREMEIFADGYVSKRRVQGLSSIKVKQGNCEGKEYTGFVSPTRKMYWRIFTSGQRIYTVLFETSSSSKRSTEIGNYFFNSFKILDNCTSRFTTDIPSDESETNFISGVPDSFSGWRKISSKRDEFELLMPTGAIFEKKQVQKNLPIEVRSYTSEHQTGIYLVQVIGDMPGGFDKSNFESLLDISQKNIEESLEGVGAKLTFLRNLRFGKYPGREYEIYSDDRIGRVQTLITPLRGYTFMFTVPKSLYSESNSDRYFNSIKISVK